MGAYAGNLEFYADMTKACPHQAYPESSAYTNITAAPSVYNEIRANNSQLYYFESANFWSQRTFGVTRKLILRLDPCSGVVYLFVRRTRPCWPNPWTCVGASTACEWTHYHSVIDGSADGKPTLLELPLTSTQWYLTVYAKSNAKYTLQIFEDPSTVARLTDGGGLLAAKQVGPDSIQLSWAAPNFYPVRSTSATKYTVYSSVYFDTGEKIATDPNLLISSSRIMDTVCGLTANTDHPYAVIECAGPECALNVTGLLNRRKYVMNVVADTSSGMRIAYAGTLVESFFDNSPNLFYLETLNTICIILGSVMAVLLGTYAWLHTRFH